MVKKLEDVLQQHRQNIYSRVVEELSIESSVRRAADKLAGVRSLISAYLTLGAGDLAQGQDLTHILLYGQEALPGPEEMISFYQAARASAGETPARANPVAFSEVRVAALEDVVESLLADVETLQAMNAVSDVSITLQRLKAAKAIFGTSPPGDYTYDYDVNGDDFLAWQRSFGYRDVSPDDSRFHPSDGNRDNFVNRLDLDVWNQNLPSPLVFAEGDYDLDENVRAEDYAIWQETFGSQFVLAADANANGFVDGSDFLTWQSRLGTNAAIGEKIIVDSVGPHLTDENGYGGVVSLRLPFPPTSNVVIALSSSDPTEGLVLPEAIVFTPENWNVPQYVSIIGVDDGVVDGTVAYSLITAPSVSLDRDITKSC